MSGTGRKQISAQSVCNAPNGGLLTGEDNGPFSRARKGIGLLRSYITMEARYSPTRCFRIASGDIEHANSSHIYARSDLISLA